MTHASGVPPLSKKANSRIRIPGSKKWTSSNPNSVTLLDLLATINFKPGKSPAGVYLEMVPRVGACQLKINDIGRASSGPLSQ